VILSVYLFADLSVDLLAIKMLKVTQCWQRFACTLPKCFFRFLII